MNAPTETEIKLAASPAMLDALAGHPVLTADEVVRQLANTWFDTPGGDLERAGATLRVRDTGNGLEQTLKLAARTGLARIEWTAPALAPCPDPAAFPPKARQQLARLTGDEALQAVAAARVERRERTVQWRGATITVAFDRGEIVAGDARGAISELELELAHGPLSAALALAGELPLGPELVWSGRSKAARAYALARRAPERTGSGQLSLDPAMPARDAFRTIAWSVLAQLLSVYPQVLDDGSPVAVHQTRVALRRLRSAIRLFRPVLPGDRAPVLRAALGTAARGLGPARDLFVLADSISDHIDPGDGEASEMLAHLVDSLATATADARAVLASTPFQRLLSEFAIWLETDQPSETGEAGAGPDLRAFAAHALSRSRKRLLRHGACLGEMDEATRHEVRKDAKQFRYSVAFLEPVWPGNHRRRIRSDFARHLARLQDSLGALNDFSVASASRDDLFAQCDPITAARFGSRLESLLHSRSGSQGKHLRRAEKALDRIADLPAWWKQG